MGIKATVGATVNLKAAPRIRCSEKFCYEYEQVLKYAKFRKYKLPSLGVRILQNQLIEDLKDEGIWGTLDVFYIFATDGDNEFAKVNWANPSLFYAQIGTNSPSFLGIDGFSFSPSASFLDTTWIPNIDSNHYKINNCSIGSYVSTSQNSDTALSLGCGNLAGASNTGIQIAPRLVNGNFNTRHHTSATYGISAGSSIGLHHMQRVVAGSRSIYRNGVGGTVNQPANTPPSTSCYIGGANLGGKLSNKSTTTQLMFWAGAAISSPSNYYSIIMNYLNSL